MRNFIKYARKNNLDYRTYTREGYPSLIAEYECIHIFFNNNYGISIIRETSAYGGAAGLFEIAVLRGNTAKSEMDYDTEITSDVVGALDEAEVFEYTEKVQKLKPR